MIKLIDGAWYWVKATGFGSGERLLDPTWMPAEYSSSENGWWIFGFDFTFDNEKIEEVGERIVRYMEDKMQNQTTILGYAYKVTLFDSYAEAAEARNIAFSEHEDVTQGGCNYYGGGRYVVWLAKGNEKEFYL